MACGWSPAGSYDETSSNMNRQLTGGPVKRQSFARLLTTDYGLLTALLATFNLQPATALNARRDWSLEFLWSLDVGAWSFPAFTTAPLPDKTASASPLHSYPQSGSAH